MCGYCKTEGATRGVATIVGYVRKIGLNRRSKKAIRPTKTEVTSDGNKPQRLFVNFLKVEHALETRHG